MEPHQLLDRLVTMVKLLELGGDEAREMCERTAVDREKMRRYYLNCINEIVKVHSVH